MKFFTINTLYKADTAKNGMTTKYFFYFTRLLNALTNLTIKNCFDKCGIKGDDELMEVQEDDGLEFEALVKEFTTDISAAEYANFDENVQASEPMFNEFEIDWRQRVREDSINAIQSLKIISDLVQKISDDDESNDENDEFEQESMGFTEIIIILDKSIFGKISIKRTIFLHRWCPL